MGYLEKKRDAFLNTIQTGRLPNSYQEVLYIKAIDNAYIGTGFYCDGNVDFDCKFSQFSANSNSLFRTTIDIGSNWFTYGMRFSTGNEMQPLIGFRAALNNFSIAYKDGSEHTIAKVDKKIFVDKQSKKTLSYADFEKIPYSLYLFARNNNGSPDQFCSGAIHYFILSENNEIKRNFIPCYYKKTGEIGMWDTVTKKFYTNQGTGYFEKGPNVVE